MGTTSVKFGERNRNEQTVKGDIMNVEREWAYDCESHIGSWAKLDEGNVTGRTSWI
jgi:hypothetical protein